MSKSLGLEITQHLEEMGSDVRQAHGFDFYLYLPTEAAARTVGVKAQEKKMAVTIQPAASGPDWLCKATLRMVPDRKRLDELGDFFQRVSSQFCGEFDGWEADIIKSK